MLQTVEGVFRDGKVELTEIPANVGDETPVIVTFLTAAGYVELESRDIDRRRALELRERLASFAVEWESAEMDIYDRYDEAKSNL